jgi:hypothetical protein
MRLRSPHPKHDLHVRSCHLDMIGSPPFGRIPALHHVPVLYWYLAFLEPPGWVPRAGGHRGRNGYSIIRPRTVHDHSQSIHIVRRKQWHVSSIPSSLTVHWTYSVLRMKSYLLRTYMDLRTLVLSTVLVLSNTTVTGCSCIYSFIYLLFSPTVTLLSPLSWSRLRSQGIVLNCKLLYRTWPKFPTPHFGFHSPARWLAPLMSASPSS